MQWRWWLTNVIHIETLFIVGMIIACIYYACKKKKLPGETYDFTGLGGIEIPHFGPVKKHPQGRGTGGRVRGNNGTGRAPRDRLNKHEEHVREIFERIFKAKFPTIRPKWLNNPVTGANLEVDGYNDNIPTPLGRGLGFEYDGGQNSRFTPKFHKSVGDIQYQRAKDSWKDACFKKENKVLIRIPDFVHYTDLERFIKTKLKREGFTDQVEKYELARGSNSGLYD